MFYSQQVTELTREQLKLPDIKNLMLCSVVAKKIKYFQFIIEVIAYFVLLKGIVNSNLRFCYI